MKSDCLKCKHNLPADCKHPKSKTREFWERPVGQCQYFEKMGLIYGNRQQDRDPKSL